MFYKVKFSLLLFLMLFSAFFFSCDKSTNVGFDILPDDYLIKSFATDTFDVKAYTYRIDSLRTGNVPTVLLGSYIDPVFGEFKASFVTEILPSTYPDFGELPSFDSIVLYIDYDTIYGKKDAEQELYISEINERLIIDSTHNYYSNYNRENLNPVLITSASFNSGKNDTLLTVRLSDEFGEQMFADVITYKDSTFKKFHNGLLLETNTNAIDASISSLNLFHKDSRLSMYYHNTKDTLEYRFYINSITCIRFNMFSQQYNSPDFIADLNNPEASEDSIIYLQGGAGLQLKLKFPELDELKNQGMWGVNRAEIILNSDPFKLPSQGIFKPPKKVLIHSINDDGKLTPLQEYINQTQYLPITYSEPQYKIDVTHEIQKIVNGTVKNNGFYISVYDGAYNPARIVLTGSNHTKPVKLLLTLTKIPE